MDVRQGEFDWVGEWLAQWWPALALLLVAYWAIKFLVRSSRKVVTPLDKSGLTIHQICTTLACTEQQAKKLLAIYDGNVSKAIQDVKTGKAVLPGSGVSDLARFGGEFKRFEVTAEGIVIHAQDGSESCFSPESKAFLCLGVVDRSQRPDKLGLGRADRGQAFGQLFWELDGEWHRFLMNASRMDYFDLGERKQNSSVRNFRVILGDLRSQIGNLVVSTPLEAFEEDLRLPLYTELTDLEAEASQALRHWNFEES